MQTPVPVIRSRGLVATTLLAVLAATFLLASAAEAAKMYKWVDENGVTHFSTRQPPRQNTDDTKLQGGTLNAPRAGESSGSTGKIKRKDLTGSGWKDCGSDLCRLVWELDPGCETSYCSRAKHYSNNCTSAGCLTKKLAFEREVEDKLAQRRQLREQQAINANKTPTPPTQGQD